MDRKRTWIAAAAIAAAVLGIGSGVALASGGDDVETPITGDALDKAKAAALAHTGGGRVTEAEVGDEEGYYEVEVTLPDGRQVDVHLDRNFQVLGTGSDGSGDDADEN